jgi:hypothetical protein
MKFKGRRLEVCQAPDPEQVLFENMEIPWWKKYFWRFVTNSVAFIMLLVCFVIILQGSIYKNKFSKQIPNLGFCSDQVPMAYGYKVYNETNDFSSYSLYRPPSQYHTKLDAQCDDVNAGSFYAVLALSEDTFNSSALVAYNFDSCIDTDGDDNYAHAKGTDGLCPWPKTQKNNEYCPCVSLTSTQECSPYYCDQPTTANTKKCTNYEAKMVGQCACFDFLLNMISKDGADATVQYIKGAKSDACYPFFVDYTKATGITYGATVITVAINMILKSCLKTLTDYECHVDADKAQASLMFKTFVSTFFNMAIVVLIAFGLITRTPEALKKASVFQGAYPDFTSAWYGVVGAYLVLTYAITVITAPISDFIGYLIMKPLNRCCVYPSVRYYP